MLSDGIVIGTATGVEGIFGVPAGFMEGMVISLGDSVEVSNNGAMDIGTLDDGSKTGTWFEGALDVDGIVVAGTEGFAAPFPVQ